MPLPEQGVENHRRSALSDIVKGRNEVLVKELTEGGASAEDIAALAEKPAEPPLDDPKRPQDVSVEDWAGMSDEDKAAHIKAAPVGEVVEETPEAKAAREAEEAKVADAPKKIKIKVDGQEQEVDEEQVRAAGIAALQKTSAADKRLEEASRLFKEAQEMIKTAAAGGVAAPQGSASTSKDNSPVADGALAKVAHAVQYGSEAEAAAALSELIQAAQSKGQTLTTNDVLELLDYRDARQWVEGQYKDVLDDPKLRKLFVDEEKRIRAAGDGRPYRELYEEIGNSLRDWKKGLAPAAPASSGTGRAEIKAKKTAVVTVPAAAARLPEKPQPKEPTQSEIIEGFRKARRQE